MTTQKWIATPVPRVQVHCAQTLTFSPLVLLPLITLLSLLSQVLPWHPHHEAQYQVLVRLHQIQIHHTEVRLPSRLTRS